MGHTPWGPKSVSLNASYHKEQQYIWFRGGVPNGFPDIKIYMDWSEWGIPLGYPISVSLNASDHKEQYILFSGGVLNGL